MECKLLPLTWLGTIHLIKINLKLNPRTLLQPWRHLSRVTAFCKAGPNVENHGMLLRDEPDALIEGHL